MSSEVGLTLMGLAGLASGIGRMVDLRGPWIIRGIPEKAGQQGGDYAVATDARTILFTTDWQPVLIQELPPERDDIRRKLLSHFSPPDHLTPAWEGRLRDLRKVCGDPVWREDCPECKGLSQTSSYLHCSFCDDEGRVYPDVRPGFICEIPVDLNRVAVSLDSFPADALIHVIADARPEGREEGQGSRLWIISRNFRAEIMGMTPAKSPGDELFVAWSNALRFPAVESGK